MSDFSMSQFVSKDDMISAMRKRIEELELELASMTAQAGAEALYSDGLQNQLTAEKALADGYHMAVSRISFSDNAIELFAADAAYRKARGM